MQENVILNTSHNWQMGNRDTREPLFTTTDDLEDRKKPRGPTMAVTPNLATSRRRRSLSLMTQEEREQQEFEEAQKHAFKARPVNRKALQTPPNGYRVPAKSQSRQSESLLEMKIDSPPRMLVSMLPYAGLPLQGKKMNTKVKPFSFDQRDQERMKKKEEKIKKVLEEEKSLSEFQARPMPLFEGNGVLARKPSTPTQVKPFALNVERRGSIKQEKFKQQVRLGRSVYYEVASGSQSEESWGMDSVIRLLQSVSSKVAPGSQSEVCLGEWVFVRS
ncbi:Targeting protein for Xklp2 [Portunus trituberculatus]|uniref:Targeting protein for Xklp2 n=1 Tax=Portunus trituberculatus TaxID=210409 RepID=A0A5B7G9N4_PORTR|nr:Targeting protein for Xklp2 [Portunus trituberculatus]